MAKKRNIAATLDIDVVEQIDKYAASEGLNRSQAIERLCSDSLEELEPEDDVSRLFIIEGPTEWVREFVIEGIGEAELPFGGLRVCAWRIDEEPLSGHHSGKKLGGRSTKASRKK